MPDLYRGSTLTAVGRYQGSGPAVITLSGRVNGRAETFTFHADFPAESLDHDFLPPLWAARRVGFLLDQIRLHGEEKELVEEVARLARQYGIVTPYTSYLIVEDEKGRVRRGDLAESDMTLGGVAAAPALEREQREQFAAMKEKSGAGSVRASSDLQKLNQAQAVAEDPLRHGGGAGYGKPGEDHWRPGLLFQRRRLAGRPRPGGGRAARDAHRLRLESTISPC